MSVHPYCTFKSILLNLSRPLWIQCYAGGGEGKEGKEEWDRENLNHLPILKDSGSCWEALNQSFSLEEETPEVIEFNSGASYDGAVHNDLEPVPEPEPDPKPEPG